MKLTNLTISNRRTNNPNISISRNHNEYFWRLGRQLDNYVERENHSYRIIMFTQKEQF